MRALKAIAVGLTIITVVGTGLASAESFYYEQVSHSTDEAAGDFESEVHGWVDGGKLKLEYQDNDKDGRIQQGNYLLTTDGGETLYMVQPSEKRYFEFEVANMLSSLENASGGAVSIEFTHVDLEMLGKEPGGEIHGRDTTKYEWKTDIGLKMKILGMKREQQMISDQQVWVAKGLASDVWKTMMKMIPSSMKGEEFVEWANKEGLDNSFPLKSITETQTISGKGKVSNSTVRSEVTVLRFEPIDALTFEIPDDYEPLEMLPPEWSNAEGAEGEAESPMKQLKGLFGGKKKNKN